MIIHHYLTGRFLRPVNKQCWKLLAAKMRDETLKGEAKESEGGRRRGVERHPRYAKMEISVNNRKSKSFKYGHSTIEVAQPDVKKWGWLGAQDYCGRVVE